MTLACAVNLQHREARLLTFYGTLFEHEFRYIVVLLRGSCQI